MERARYPRFYEMPHGQLWSGREDLNLRPLRPERSALPGCATPRPGRIEYEWRIVLQDGCKTQAMRFRHRLACDRTVHDVDPFGQTGIGLDSACHAFRGKTNDVGQRSIGQR